MSTPREQSASGGVGVGNSSPASAPSVNLPVKFDASQLDKLTELERKFVLHPEVMTKPEKAAVEVGWSASWARARAHQKRQQLMYYILPIAKERWAKADITLDRIHEELAAVAFADETEYYERVDVDLGDGKGAETLLVGKDPTMLPKRMSAAVEQINIENLTLAGGDLFQVVSFVLHDKKPALKMLAEMLGGFDPKNRQPSDAAEKLRQGRLFDFMEQGEIDTIVKIYNRAEKRSLAAAVDAEIITEAKK